MAAFAAMVEPFACVPVKPAMTRCRMPVKRERLGRHLRDEIVEVRPGTFVDGLMMK